MNGLTRRKEAKHSCPQSYIFGKGRNCFLLSISYDINEYSSRGQSVLNVRCPSNTRKSIGGKINSYSGKVILLNGCLVNTSFCLFINNVLLEVVEFKGVEIM